MATKTIDVTLVAIRNTGERRVAPKGLILCQITRAVDDEQIFRTELLYNRTRPDEPIHLNGARFISPNESLNYDVVKTLTVQRFDKETEGQLNQMLVLHHELSEVLSDSFSVSEIGYLGSRRRHVQFDEITEVHNFTQSYSAFTGDVRASIEVEFTVTLIAED